MWPEKAREREREREWCLERSFVITDIRGTSSNEVRSNRRSHFHVRPTDSIVPLMKNDCRQVTSGQTEI